ncbi:MAG: hypothetical protein JNM29_14260 [Candidatus Odyssella sp.]|nr:hypothetical protein [Candidatus Odyssella sp.]
MKLTLSAEAEFGAMPMLPRARPKTAAMRREGPRAALLEFVMIVTFSLV